MEQVGICFEGAITVFVHKGSQSPSFNIVQVYHIRAGKRISNPLVYPLESNERG